MSRSYARECAFKLVFEYLFSKEKDEQLLATFLSEEKCRGEEGYITDVYNGVVSHYEEYVADVERVSKGFRAERIYKIDLAIILVAMFEMKTHLAPDRVCINEALNLAKAYSTEKSASFVNGILSNFIGE